MKVKIFFDQNRKVSGVKKLRIIETEIGQLEIPREIRQLIRIKLGEDCGSNLMEGYNGDMGFNNGWLAKKFNGYESTGRQPFTIEDVENFIIECCNHPKMAERYSQLLILIIGQIDLLANNEDLVEDEQSYFIINSLMQDALENNWLLKRSLNKVLQFGPVVTASFRN